MVAVAQPQSVLTGPWSPPRPVIGGLLNSIKFAKDSVGYTRELFQEYGHLVALAEGGGTRLYSPPGRAVLAQSLPTDPSWCVRSLPSMMSITNIPSPVLSIDCGELRSVPNRSITFWWGCLGLTKTTICSSAS